jgi:hypothetical protein
MLRSEKGMVELKPRRPHPRREGNPFDLAMGLKVEVEHETARTGDKGRSFELFVASLTSLRRHTGRSEAKAA